MRSKPANESSGTHRAAAKPLKIYVDGKFVPESEAKVSVFDHGLLYGDGIFEGIRFYNGRVFRLEEHHDRLWDSARSICLEIPMSPEDDGGVAGNDPAERAERRLHSPDRDARRRQSRLEPGAM